MKVQNSSNPKRQRLTHDKVKAFGNKDTEKQYPIGQDAIDAGLYVIRSYKNFTETDPKGKVVDRGIEDPATARMHVFTQSKYNEFIRENEKEGKVNTFHKLLGKYAIVHDPTLESDKDFDEYDFTDTNVDTGNQTTPAAPLTKEQLLEQLKALEDAESDDSDSDEDNSANDTDSGNDDLLDELAGMTKAELLERLNGLPATDEELHTAANPATKKADIISLIEKYQNN